MGSIVNIEELDRQLYRLTHKMSIYMVADYEFQGINRTIDMLNAAGKVIGNNISIEDE